MKTVLITGSTSGIGLGIAKEFAIAGFQIAFNGLESNGLEIANQIGEEYGVKTAFYDADLRNPDSIEDMVMKAINHFGNIDVLINNAGIQYVAPIEEFPTEKWNAIIDVNLNAVFHTSKSVWNIMKKK